MKVAATINGADLLLLIPTTSDILFLADVVGFALGAAIVAREGNQREHSSQTVTKTARSLAQYGGNEVTMFTCSVCQSHEFKEKLTEEIFQFDGKDVLVDRIPATVCVRCGEETFSRETTERVRLLVHGQARPFKSIALDVFEFA